MKDIYEKLGLFYLGKDSEDEAFTLYKSKHLTTHAAIIGMTGSGKTGLGIGLIEEAALDNIPALVIDPKGDMGNLCLSFPQMKAEDYLPWIDKSEALAKEKTLAQMAEDLSTTNRKGIESFGQDLTRVKKLSEVEKTIYTPGSSAGIGVNVLGSFAAPSDTILDDSDTFTSLINTTVSSLLALVDIKNSSIHSKEHLLLSNIFYHYWSQGISLSIESIIGFTVSPPFEKVGMLSLSNFYPQNERMKLAQLFNGVIASISFSAWIKGEPLDIQNMLYDEHGKAKVAIFSIAHLGDKERMFFVTMLLNAYISWMRRQRGSATLKTILYMDEIFGFFPPSKNPPSKEPMLLLLKQARAFGVGVVLSTQNPVDIDYKGLSNIGTWFIGKLQTKQDIEKVLDGVSAHSSLSKSAVAHEIATLKGRHFFLKNVHSDTTSKFYTRWVLSYLKGPMSKDDIRLLMKEKKKVLYIHEKKTQNREKKVVGQSLKPIISEGIKEYFYDSDINAQGEFYPYLYAEVKLRFYNQKRAIDTEETLIYKLDIDELINEIEFENAEDIPLINKTTKVKTNAKYAQLSPLLKNAKNLKAFEKKLLNHLYHTKRLELFASKELKLESKVGESEVEFKVNMQDRLKEMREDAVEKLQKKFDLHYKRYETKFTKLRRKLEKEENDVSSKVTDTLISVGMTFLSAFLGRKTFSTSTLRKGASSLKKGKDIFKEKKDVKDTQALMEELQLSVKTLEKKLATEIQIIQNNFQVEKYTITKLNIKPRRTDISIDDFALLWEATLQ